MPIMETTTKFGHIIITKNEPKPTLTIYKEKSKALIKTPLINYYYKSIKDRNEDLQRYLDIFERNKIKKETETAIKKEIQKNLNKLHPFKLGDIFVNSWGYEQTNINYYQVTEIKNKTLTLMEIGSELLPHIEGYSSMSGFVMPIKNSFEGQPIKKAIKFYLGSENEPIFYLTAKHGGMSLYKEGEKNYKSWYY